MCRLPQLLHFFRLPPTATAAELRHAYLARVKQVHPDLCRGASSNEFQELQANFEEALGLLNHNSKRKNPFIRHMWGQDREPQFWHQTERQASVPTKGLSGAAVYPMTASIFAAGGMAFYLSQRRQPSPTVNSTSQAVKPTPAEARRAPKTEEPEERKASWPALSRGPWNVNAAKVEEMQSKGVWAPSKAWEFQNKDSFYGSRAQGHLRANIGQRKRLGQDQGKQVGGMSYEASHDPVMRDGVQMLPVHLASEDGHVWWLEQCGATVQCRNMLSIGDTREDTPLHHCARCGQDQACRALLRLGADPSVKNSEQQMPEEVAAVAGHSEIANMIRKARASGSFFEAEDQESTLRHPDGLGVLREPPSDVVFTGLKESGVMRRAVNMAAGCAVTPPLPVGRAMSDAQDAADRVVNVARGSLQGTEFDLEDLRAPHLSAIQAREDASAIWEAVGRRGADLQGILLYEPPGAVTPDAPGHWVAVRSGVEPADGFFRLDPVRGPFHITHQELKDLLGRYRAWRVVQQTRELRMARTAKLGAAAKESAAAVEARENSAYAR